MPHKQRGNFPIEMRGKKNIKPKVVGNSHFHMKSASDAILVKGMRAHN